MITCPSRSSCRSCWRGCAGCCAAANGSRRNTSTSTITFAGKKLDLEALELHVGDKKYQLTQMECDLLQYLVKNAGKAVSRKSILEDVWDLHEDTDTRAIDNFIVRLRRYLEKDPTKPKHLLTVRGVGYKFVAGSPARPAVVPHSPVKLPHLIPNNRNDVFCVVAEIIVRRHQQRRRAVDDRPERQRLEVFQPRQRRRQPRGDRCRSPAAAACARRRRRAPPKTAAPCWR